MYISGFLVFPGVQISPFFTFAFSETGPALCLGIIWRQWDNTTKDLGKILSSPLLVFPGNPVTPTISPRLTPAWNLENSASSSSEVLASAMTWTLAPPSCKS
uniref:Uncharacterized protein n=1 Tax=Opuntia streptacantha TaxID=393608 RepID=A0A7C9D2M2_OPUST